VDETDASLSALNLREPFSAERASKGVGAKRTDGEAIAASVTEPRTFGVIFERHFGSILRYLRRRLDDQRAEEAAAQTFFVAFDERGRFDPERGDARPWLFGIATNVARRHRRGEVRELRAIAALGAESVAGEEGAERRLDAERLRGPLARCLAELPAEESDVLYLLVWAELDQPEIAAALEIPLGTVKSRLSRARKRLREALELPDPDPTTPDLTKTGGKQ
jgi:RNA polymerase sigma factor (sigma-70 family)